MLLAARNREGRLNWRRARPSAFAEATADRRSAERVGWSTGSGQALRQFSAETILWTLLVLIVLPPTFAACSKTIDQTIDDATITAAVKTALLNDPEVGATKIDVDTANGVVTLSGSVKSQVDAEKAIALARRAPGVKDVKSALHVNAPTGATRLTRPTRLT